MDSPLWIYLIGFFAQCLYTARVIVQWYLSEKHHRVESPGIFWMLSIVGSMILFLYGYLRHDLSIIIGELLSYYIYMWNINAKGLYQKVPRPLIWAQACFPLVIIGLMLKDFPQFSEMFLPGGNMPLALLVFGTTGQVIYKSRFIYQIIYSSRRGESTLPLGMWILAVTGSLMIIIYGIIRHDWVLVIGQFGIFASIRNIMIYFSSKKREDEAAV